MATNGGDGSAPEQSDELARLRAENAELRSDLGRRVRWRQILAIVLVVLTSVTLVAAAVAVWARQTVFDTDHFMEAVGPSLQDPDFYSLIGDEVSEPVIEALALEERLAQRLAEIDAYLSEALLDALEVGEAAREILNRFDRPQLEELATPIAAAINERIDAGIHAFFMSEDFTSRFPGLVRRTHEAAIAIARGQPEDFPNVYVEDGEVRVNLIPSVVEALRRLGDEIRGVLPDFELPDVISEVAAEGREQLESVIQASLPEDFGQVSVMSEARLTEIRTTVVQIDRYVWAAVLLTIVLLVLALVVSPNRGRTAVHLGIGVFVAVVVSAVVMRQIQSAIVDGIADPRGSEFARSMLNDLFSGLRTLQVVFAVGAILIATVAYVASRPDWMERLTVSTGAMLDRDVGDSRADVWIARYSGLLRALGILIAAAALFFVGLDLLSLVIIGVLLVAYLWVIYAATARTGGVDRQVEEETAEV